MTACADHEWKTWARSAALTAAPVAGSAGIGEWLMADSVGNARAAPECSGCMGSAAPADTSSGGAAGATRPRYLYGNYRKGLISIVSSRPGPTPIAEIGAPDISSSALTYARAFFGRSSKVLAPLMSSLQPGSIS